MSKRRPSRQHVAAAEQAISEMNVAERRAMASALVGRGGFANLAGLSFSDARDLYTALGYARKITPQQYRARYERGGIAKRLVEAFPMSTWRGGGELVEDEDPEVETEFEKAFFELNQRLSIWTTFLKTDILAGLGQFAVILLGAPGQLDGALASCRAEDLKYLAPFSQRDVTVVEYDKDTTSERFGQPIYYGFRRINYDGRVGIAQSRVHFSRVIHVAEGQLDDPMYGTPRMQAVWNYLDDLDKVVGGGAEAYWKRVDGGKQFKLDPMLQPAEGELTELKDKIEEYTHGLRRVLTTRGVDIQDLGSSVSSFSQGVSSLIDLISATSGIPQRLFTGSERGELASSSDESNYDDRVADRRHDFADVQCVRPFIDRLISLGVLPEPQQYETRWPDMDDMDDDERMTQAKQAAEVNKTQGETVITTAEIRDRILAYPPLEDVTDEDKELNVAVVDEEPLTPQALLAAARSPVKRVRLLRLSAKGRATLKKGRSKKWQS